MRGGEKKLEVTYSDVQRNSEGKMIGRVDYARSEDMEEALRLLDDSEFANKFDNAVVRVTQDEEHTVREERPRDDDRDRHRDRHDDEDDRPRDKHDDEDDRPKENDEEERERERSPIDE